MRSLKRELLRQRGGRSWDAVLYGSGASALLGLPAVALSADLALLVALLFIAILIHGPVSFLFQGAFEPILMWYGSRYEPLLVALVGTVGVLYIEAVNYVLLRAAWSLRVVEDAVAAPKVGRVLDWFQRTRAWSWCERRPFWMVALCMASPLPDTLGRIAAVARGYPMPPYLAAHFLGRFPRFWIWAWLGSFLPVDPRYFEWATMLSVLLGIVGLLVMWSRSRRAPTRPPGGSGSQAPPVPA